MTSNSLHHSVYFWLRQGGTPDDARKTIDACRAYLTDIPGILSFTVGTPAGTEGPPVDNSYAVALLIEFEDRAAHDAYDVHSNHQKFIAECSSLWSRVQVFDVFAA